MTYSRRLVFFVENTVRDAEHDDLLACLMGAQPSCCTSGRGFLWIGDSDGMMHQFNRGLQVTSFKAHSQSVQHACQLKEHDILLTIGKDDTNEEQLKVWNIAKWAKKPTPFCFRTTNVGPSGQATSTVTCLHAHEDMNSLVLGHIGGQVQLFRGDITRERTCKRHLLHTFSSPVTGLGLHLLGTGASGTSDTGAPRVGQTQSPVVIVFATTSQSIMSFVLGKRDEVITKTLLDRFGAGPDCSTLVTLGADSFHYAVACQAAVYFYNWDGRGPCLATDGKKVALSVFKQYLVIVKSQVLTPVSNLPHTQSAFGAYNTSLESIMVTIHDQPNKFIAGEFTFPNFRFLFVEWGGIYVICANQDSDGRVKHSLQSLTEKSTQQKLDMLFSKQNFQLAIDIAKSHHFGEEQLAHIYWQYADQLYKQKEYDAAIKEYIKTVGILEVSFVIQRFVDGGHISQLAHYLEALNTAGLASSDHLSLLLNCYARLQDHTRLSQFVQGPLNPLLNVSAAIHMLRQFSFSPIALQLARSSTRFADEVCILLEDLDDCRGALESIGKFPFDEALKAVCNYGHLLMDRLPAETVQLLDKLCSHPDASRINVHHFLKIFINNREGLMQFLERYISTADKSSEVTGIVDTLLELILYEWNRLQCNPDADSTDSSTGAYSKTDLSNMALRLLRDTQLPYNEKKALLMCHRWGFDEACVFLWEKLKLYDPLLNHYMDANSHTEVLHVCQRFGNEMPKLWLLALRYFATKPDCADQLHTVVSEVDRCHLAPPMAVLHVLSDTDSDHSCQVGTVRDYLLRHLEAGTNQIKALQQEVEQLRSETMRNREVVRTLNSQVKIFQQQKCALCHQSLGPPSVHFLCDHSYHALCFESYAYGDQRCPECAPKHKKLLSEISGATSIEATNLLPEQVIEYFRTALNTDPSSFIASQSDTNSPTVDKYPPTRAPTRGVVETPALAQSQSPSARSFSSIGVPALERYKDVWSVKSRDSSPTASVFTPSQNINPFLMADEICPDVSSKSASMGYFSGDAVQRPVIQPQVSVTKVAINPFDEPDTEVAQTKSLTRLTTSDSASDPGLGPSVRSLNPFEDAS